VRNTVYLCLLFVAVAGCQPDAAPLPKTYPVSGKVVLENGQPLRSGMVMFQSAADPSVTTTGVIQSDGSFSLTTLRDGQRADGAVAGQHRVTVIPPQDETQSAMVTVFREPYTVEAGDNDFTLVIEPPQR